MIRPELEKLRGLILTKEEMEDIVIPVLLTSKKGTFYDEDKPEEYKPRVRTESLFNLGDWAVIEITGTPSQFKNFDACRNELVEASTSLHLLCAELVLSALNYGFTVELCRR